MKIRKSWTKKFDNIGYRSQGGIYKTSYDNVTINLKAGGLNQESLA